MSPRHQLIVSVAIIAAVIIAAWMVLFRNHALTPPVTMPAGPSLPEIGKQFDQELEQFNRLIEPAANRVPAAPAPPPAPTVPIPGAASDDVRTPPEPVRSGTREQ